MIGEILIRSGILCVFVIIALSIVFIDKTFDYIGSVFPPKMPKGWTEENTKWVISIADNGKYLVREYEFNDGRWSYEESSFYLRTEEQAQKWITKRKKILYFQSLNKLERELYGEREVR